MHCTKKETALVEKVPSRLDFLGLLLYIHFFQPSPHTPVKAWEEKKRNAGAAFSGTDNWQR